MSEFLQIIDDFHYVPPEIKEHLFNMVLENYIRRTEAEGSFSPSRRRSKMATTTKKHELNTPRSHCSQDPKTKLYHAKIVQSVRRGGRVTEEVLSEVVVRDNAMRARSAAWDAYHREEWRPSFKNRHKISAENKKREREEDKYSEYEGIFN